jgi:hypothetical protein
MSVVLGTTYDSQSVRWSPRGGLPQSFSFQITLVGQITQDWKVVRPLPVNIERGDDSIIMSDDVFAIYGQGDDIAAALQDYYSALIEYHQVLSFHNDEPSVRLLQRLQSYLQPA